MVTIIQSIQQINGVWIPVDERGQDVRQQFRIAVAGRATKLVDDLAWQLSEDLSWATYGENMIPWGLPYRDQGTAEVPASGFLVRPTYGGGVEYGYTPTIDSSVAMIEFMLRAAADPSQLSDLYDRMEAVEDALMGYRGASIGRS